MYCMIPRYNLFCIEFALGKKLIYKSFIVPPFAKEIMKICLNKSVYLFAVQFVYIFDTNGTGYIEDT